jgi:hypothetical protein
VLRSSYNAYTIGVAFPERPAHVLRMFAQGRIRYAPLLSIADTRLITADESNRRRGEVRQTV